MAQEATAVARPSTRTIKKTRTTTRAPKKGPTPKQSVLLEPLPSILPSSQTEAKPTDEQIRERAYYIFLERGGQPGDPDADWAQAERELRARAA